jgi:hypothetical protein
MLSERIERLVLRINRDLNVLWNGNPLALRPVISTLAAAIPISETTRSSRSVTTIPTRWTSGSITTRRAARAITTRACASTTTKATFPRTTTACSAAITAEATTATAFTTITALRTVFSIAKALDNFLLLAEIRDPRGYQAQAGQIE